METEILFFCAILVIFWYWSFSKGFFDDFLAYNA